MNASSVDPLTSRLQDWAAAETEGQKTPLTPALLRLRQRLAVQDARRRRRERLHRALLVVPGLLLLGIVASGGFLGVRFLERLLSVQAGMLTASGLMLGLFLCMGQIWSAE